MANDPLVSVIIPTYNRASLIGAAIDSVLNQTFKNVEIIVVDDGSTDETQRVLEGYAGKITSLVTENNGPAHARNVGMKAATGKYIAFLDSDDMYLPRKLELEVAFMERHPDIGMVSTNMSAMKGGEIVEEYHLKTYHGAFFEDGGQTLEDIYSVRGEFEFHGQSIPCYSGNIFKQMLHWPVLLALTVLFRRDILSVVGYQQEAYRLAEDYDYMVRICKRFAVACLDVPTYIYRYSDHQASMIGSTWSSKRLSTWIGILQTMVQVALEHGKSDPDYYSNNRAWLDPLLSRKYSELGRRLIDFGDVKKARECFSKAHDYAPSDETFFRKMLGDVDEPAVPYGFSDVQGDAGEVAQACSTLDASFANRLREQTRARGVTTASICHLAWALVLARLSGRNDVVFGTALPGSIQNEQDADGMPGPSMDPLPVRIRIGDESVQECVRNVYEILEELLRHKHAPLALAQRCSAMPASAPLFTTLLNFRSNDVAGPSVAQADPASTAVEFLNLEEQKNYSLLVSMVDCGDGLALAARVHSPIDPQRICSYMVTALEHLVRALETAPTTSLHKLEVLSDSERHQLLVDFNKTHQDSTHNILMHELFEAQAKRTPDRTALKFGVTSVSYAELDRRANRIAQALRARGVSRGQRVGLCLERGTDMVAAVLGILKAGAAYVPLDPSFPAERLHFMAQDAELSLLLSTSVLVSPFGLPREQQLLLDNDTDILASQATDQRLMPDETQDARPEDPAYMIYTSGSTGTPKGVLVPHRAVVNFLISMAHEPGLTANDVLLAVTTLSFDIAVLELQLPLTLGATVVIASRDEACDGRALASLLKQHSATVMQATPASWRLLLEAGWTGSKNFKALIGGEALPKDLADQLLERGVNLWNMYGPTETTVWSTCAHITDTSKGIVIGKPIANTTVYILDAQKNLCPMGVPGELYIGGDGVTLGYWNRPELTAERFIPDLFSTTPGATLYRTGDRARWRSDGTLEHLGRLDFQVKIRGYRIELGEIEASIARHPAIHENVVVVREDVPGDARLVAYVVVKDSSGSNDFVIQQLRKYLSETLPDYMVPSAFVVLNDLPLTPSGKIDRKALPAPERSAIAEITYVAPRTSSEKILAEIWAEALGVERVGIEVSFFDLGGHSLLAMQVLARARQALSAEFSLREFLANPTIAGLSACLELQHKNDLQDVSNGASQTGIERSEPVTALPRIVPSPEDKHLPFPLTDIQQAYWVGRSGMFDLGNVATHVYTEYDCAELDLVRFSRAWQKLIKRHDMLRAIVRPDGQQQILEEVPPYEIQVLDLRGQSPQAVASQLESVRRKMSHQVLKSDCWPLFEIRASLLDNGRVRLHVSRDVLMIDGWSASILDRELCQFYQHPDAILPDLEISFRDYVLAQIGLRDTELYQRSRDYWWERLDSLPPAPELPLATAPSLIATPQFARRSKRLEPLVWKSLKRRAARSGLTSSGLLLAVFADVLKLWSKSPRFTLNLTLANRLPLHPQVNDLVGDFTSVVLLAVDDSEGGTFEERARRLQKQLWNDLDHRFVSGVEIMRELAKRQGNMRGGLMPVVFTSFLGQVSSNELSDQLGPVVYSISQTSQVSLDFVVFEVEGRLQFHWDAVEELFPDGLLDDMFNSYCRFLERLADDENGWQERWPETAQALLPVWQLEQRAQVNDTGAPITDHLLHSLFANQVKQRPQQAAVISAERALSYEELHRRGNQIGHWLRANGAQRNSLVAVVMEKGWEQVAAVLGVLASGAAYLPIDAGLPKERLWHLLKHGEVTLVLTQPRFDKKIEWPETIKRLVIDDDSLAGLSEQTLDLVQSPEDIAYVIYTSGSTGLPKGVVIDHRGAVNTILDLNSRFRLTAQDRVLALSSLSFDLSVYDIFGILAAGGTIVVPDAAGLRDPAHWADLIARHRVTLWNSVPALMQMLVEYLEGRGQRLAGDLRLVFMSGDWIPVTLPERILALHPDLEVISMGGATEASIWSIIYPIEKIDHGWKSIPYGRPMANQTFHVLNDVLEPCPIWVAGQLYIGGIGLAKGYWRDEEKTSASFIIHPRTKERLYRTGDQGRYLPDGNIEFLGRDDFQVKVQGYRIELGEIETILTQHPRVQTAAVAAIGPAGGNKKLVAYVVPERRHAPDNGQDKTTPNASNGHSDGQPAPDEILRDPLARLNFKLKTPGRRINNGRASILLKKTEATDDFLQSYTSRRSYRKFISGTISFDNFSQLLNSLSPVKIADTPFPKYRYASAGGLYPVQTYLYVKPERVEGLPGGSYFYDATNHSLVPLSPGAQIGSTEFQGSQAIFDQSAFALFFVAQLKSIAPMYGELARDFCVIEVGSMCQLLETSAPSHQIGLCQIGGLDFQPIRHLFDLEKSHIYLHCLLGGPIRAEQSKRQAFIEEMSEYANFLRTLQEQPGPSTSDQGIAEELHHFLQGKLPDYMIPANFVVLDKLPLSSNGKVDRKALPEPTSFDSERVENLPKEWTGQAARIAALVKDILKVKNIDPETNLFDLGATSVDVIRIINAVERELDFRPKVEAFYRLPTVAALTHSYEQHLLRKTPFQEAPVARDTDDYEEGKL